MGTTKTTKNTKRGPAAFALCVLCGLCGFNSQTQERDWGYYGGDLANSKYSALSQIHPGNVKNLRIAWRWKSPDNSIVRRHPSLRPFTYEATPLAVNGVLYTSTSLSQAAAIDALTGETLWVYDPQSYRSGAPANVGFVSRGVSYWSQGTEQRIFLATGDGYLIALNARTGQPSREFGEKGRIDLTRGLGRLVNRRQYAVTSPPIVCRNVVVVGSSIADITETRLMPPGDVRGFDARTGKQIWMFHSVPPKGAYGNETWEGDSWKHTGNTNAWTLMSADEELGYVYVPFSSPTNDYYGGHRLGENLFADSLVCLDAKTGKRIWHFQTVHHDLWDYDLASAPNLVDIAVGGRKIKAVAQTTKHGFCFVLNRKTGEPVWPIEERPVPSSRVPGERASPTQPFPAKPQPFELQGLRTQNLIDFTAALREEAVSIAKRYNHGPMFTPPAEEKSTVYLPGNAGGANWNGAAFDPESGLLYVPSVTRPYLMTLEKKAPRSDFRYKQNEHAELLVPGPRGLPITKPPYSRISAIDLNRGEIRWALPLGQGPRNHPLLKHLRLPRLGSGGRGFLLLTKTVLFVGEGHSIDRLVAALQGKPFVDCCANQPKLYAFNKSTGQLIWEMNLPNFPTGAPMTHLVRGRQYLVIAIGGLDQPAELVALTAQ